MAIRKRKPTAEQAQLLADEIADRAYGEDAEPTTVVEDQYVTTSISIPSSMPHELEDLAVKNKRSKSGPKNVSALIRQAVAKLLTSNS